MSVVVEVIDTHDCAGRLTALPEAVQRFVNESGVAIESRIYRPWDLTDEAELPGHVRTALAAIRAGERVNYGCFVNGRWLPVSPHNAADSVALRKALFEAAGLQAGVDEPDWHSRDIGRGAITSSVATASQLNDNTIADLGAFCNQIERAWFFDGSIGSMSVDCRVGSLRYGGYEVTKLVEIANRHPDLFADARLTGAGGEAKDGIAEVEVRLLTADDLARGSHSCVITGGRMDPASGLQRAAAESFGGWG